MIYTLINEVKSKNNTMFNCFLLIILLILSFFVIKQKNKYKFGFNKIIHTVNENGVIMNSNTKYIKGNMLEYAIYSDKKFKYKLI